MQVSDLARDLSTEVDGRTGEVYTGFIDRDLIVRVLIRRMRLRVVLEEIAKM